MISVQQEEKSQYKLFCFLIKQWFTLYIYLFKYIQL